MPRIFISHASADDEKINLLSDWLTGNGHEDHFVDHKHIPPGKSWDAELRKAASEADMLILFVTPNWLSSGECFAEYRSSFYGDRTVLPLLVDGLRAQDLEGAARERFDTLCASVQAIPVATLPPEGFTAEQIEAAITRVTHAARKARGQRLLALSGLAAIVLVATLITLVVNHATYVGELLAKWQVNRGFATATDTSGKFRDCDDESLCPEMVALPPATYQIGYVEEAYHNRWEAPIQTVEIEPFAVSVFEVTKSQWRACVLSTRHAEGGAARCKELVYSEAAGREPVESITWHDAQDYIAWLNLRVSSREDGPYRLLSEAEWEYAARGGETPRTTFSWGEGMEGVCEHANMLNHVMPEALDVWRSGWDCSGAEEDNPEMLNKVGEFKPNAFRLYDTAGNVSEWVADCWHESHEGRPADIGAGPWISDAPVDCKRVLKGGSWIGHIDLLRPSARVGLEPDVYGFNIGLRVARDIEP